MLPRRMKRRRRGAVIPVPFPPVFAAQVGALGLNTTLDHKNVIPEARMVAGQDRAAYSKLHCRYTLGEQSGHA